MRVLVVGGGGREHALCWAISASPLVEALFCAPGNPGIQAVAACVPIPSDDLDRLVRFAEGEKIDLVVVGPEAPLVGGLVDKLKAVGIRAFGPSAAAAQLEGSKSFMKALCDRHDIPTARFARFSDAAAAKAYVAEQGAPIVVKADGLASGKGVVVAETVAMAEAAVDAALVDDRFGDAGREIVVEEFLTGIEVSLFALADGQSVLPFGSAHDYKRAHDGDRGPNTGGMGSVSPTPRLAPAVEAQAMETIVEPLVAAMAAEGMPFVGVVYAGLMLTEDGPKLLEVNTRFGDPECQVLMARLSSDLVPILVAACDGMLSRIDLRWSRDAAVCVVMAAPGYPDDPVKGGEIGDLAAIEARENVLLFHAGTRRDAHDGLRAWGGRVFGVTGLGTDRDSARAAAYGAVDALPWADGWCRRDIGQQDGAEPA